MRTADYILTFVFAFTAIFAKATTGKFYTGNVLSSGFVTCMVQDQKGFIWMGTNFGLNRFDGYHFTTYTHRDDDQHTLPNNSITTLYADQTSRLWVGSASGLSLYQPSTDTFERIILSPDILLQPHIASISCDSKGRIYVGTSGFGLYEITGEEHKIRKVTTYSTRGNEDYYSCIYIDRHDRLWRSNNENIITCHQMGTGKLLLYNRPNVGTIMRILDDGHGNIVFVCQHAILRYDGKRLARIDDGDGSIGYSCAFLSRDGKLVIGTNNHGLLSMDRSGTITPLYLANDQVDLTTANINVFLEDRSHNIWIGCAEKGLAFVPGEKPYFSTLSLQQMGMRSSNIVSSICQAGGNNVLLTISGGGLYCKDFHTGTQTHLPSPDNANLIYRDRNDHYWLCAGTSLFAYDLSSGSLTSKAKFDCIDIRAMADDNKNLYISAFGTGLCQMNFATGNQKMYSMFDPVHAHEGRLCNNWILKLMRDRYGMIWIGTASGAQCFDPRNNSFRPYGWNNLLDGRAVISLAEDSQGNIVLGTSSGLFLYNRTTRKTALFPYSEKIKDLKINYVASFANGDLWCSTSMGIWHLDKRRKRFTAYTNGYGLLRHEYLDNVGLVAADGHIILGNPDGIVLFNPQRVSEAKYSALQPILTNIMVGGKPVNAASLSDGSPIVDGAVSETRRIVLSYIDNTFSLEYSSFDFANLDNTQLEYRLDNDQWSLIQEGHNAISFSHLQPGTYKLEVRTNNHGHTSPSTTYMLVVSPPWYRSTFAYFIYFLLLTTAASGVVYAYHRRKQQELYEDKMQFLINATHDIRTPLTLIMNPLHQLMQMAGNLPQVQDKLQTISHSANRILTLVNQILDLRKMDKMQLNLQCTETSLLAMIKDVFRVFDYEAHKRKITFHCDAATDIKAYVDPKEFDKVITNLLSNAFKFTPDGGDIAVRLFTEAGHAMIEVADTGIGLKDVDTERIFSRFYQSGTKAVNGVEGTGIGLNLCRIIVGMHHGQISAYNRTDVHGSVFRVSIPLGKSHLKPEEIVNAPAATDPVVAAPVKRPGTNYHVLLVDDDAEITEYICRELGQYYHFSICRNGEQAIGELLSGKYDLVVSDVMMPEMDGFTMLRMIKTNSLISHIPVVLLTTEAAIGNRLEGLERGADAFLAKPFLMDELRATIDNLIVGRLKLKGKYSGAQEQSDKVEPKQVADSDKELMDRIMKSINKNIGDSDFNVEMLCQEIFVSRTQLHRKMKELTGLSTAEFIRNIRLEQAARLLKEKRANISQVAYTLGFTNTAHFSKVFKQHFGVPPSEYGKREGSDK